MKAIHLIPPFLSRKDCKNRQVKENCPRTEVALSQDSVHTIRIQSVLLRSLPSEFLSPCGKTEGNTVTDPEMDFGRLASWQCGFRSDL